MVIEGTIYLQSKAEIGLSESVNISLFVWPAKSIYDLCKVDEFICKVGSMLLTLITWNARINTHVYYEFYAYHSVNIRV